MFQGWCWSCIFYNVNMMFEGKVAALQAQLDYHSQRQKPDVYGRGVVSVQLQAKFTQKKRLLYLIQLQSRPGPPGLSEAYFPLSMNTPTLCHPFKTEDEMGLVHDFSSTFQRQIQSSHRLLNKTWGVCGRVGCVCGMCVRGWLSEVVGRRKEDEGVLKTLLL